jgi:hypothetical protein
VQLLGARGLEIAELLLLILRRKVARYTRHELVLNQAILARLGALRAMLFRAAVANGTDVYFVNFANGSAEWRIGLVKQGKIGRMALGPQY